MHKQIIVRGNNRAYLNVLCSYLQKQFPQIRFVQSIDDHDFEGEHNVIGLIVLGTSADGGYGSRVEKFLDNQKDVWVIAIVDDPSMILSTSVFPHIKERATHVLGRNSCNMTDTLVDLIDPLVP